MSLRQQNKRQARINILAAADKLIREKGIDSATTREIAQLARVSYQTLYNYFPNKVDIVHGFVESEMVNWADAADNVTKHYAGNLVDSLLQLIQVNLDLIERLGRELVAYITIETVKQGAANSVFMTATRTAHEHYYALLNLAQGMGHLDESLDLHLMAHTLFNLTDYAMLRYFIEPIEDGQFLTSQRELFTLVITPYLVSENP